MARSTLAWLARTLGIAAALTCPTVLWAQVPPPAPEATLEDDWRATLADLDERRAVVDALFARHAPATGDERRLVWGRMVRRGRAYVEELEAAVARLNAAQRQGRDVTGQRARIVSHVEWTTDLLRRELEETERLVAERRGERESQPLDERFAFEQELSREIASLDRLLRAVDRALEWKRTLDLDMGGDEGDLEDRLHQRADRLASRALLAAEQLAEVEALVQDAPPDELAPLQARERALEERLRGLTAGLTATIGLMEGRGLDATEHKQALIRVTGDVTAVAIDRRVALGLAQQWWQGMVAGVRDSGPRIIFKLLVFLLILAAFRVLGRIAARLVRRGLSASSARVPALLENLAETLTANGILLIGLLVGLSQLGLEVGPMLASLGVAGFILGFALQDSLSNFAAGAMILLYQPFDVGDVVKAGGVSGKVRHLSLVSTTILTFDNQKLIVPNRKIWGDVIRNVTAEETRRVDLVFAVRYQEDVDRALDALRAVAVAEERILSEPAPLIKVNDLSQGRVDLILRPWVKTTDYWGAYWDLNRAVKQRFDAVGISLAVPQREVQLRQDKPTST